ncbi:MAG: MlaD family protein [Acidobacteria bacterium]|nr:MlaD family protein [Acidobacteriota bacterium]MCI0722242.1 MlaD family protein [Acidobacteriota bacterium]
MSRVARLGAFIFGALLILTFVVFRIGDKDFLFSATYRLQAPFDTVAGLGNGAEVRLGGVRVGSVDFIQLPGRAGEKVLVVMKLESSTRKLIRKDSLVSIETEGLLGNKHVTIMAGSQNAPAVEEGDTLQSQAPVDFSDLIRKTEDILDTTQSAIKNVNDATAGMKSITTKIDQGQGTAGALINNREIYNEVRATVADTRETVSQAKAGMTSFQENMQALKSNWFLRGFFKSRGYQDSAELTKHAIPKLPERPFSNRFEIGGNDLFDKPETAKLKNEKLLNRIGALLERSAYELIVVAAYAGLRGETEENLVLTQARAMVVREHLAEHFKIDDRRIKTIGMGETPGAPRIEIIVYPPQPIPSEKQDSVKNPTISSR